MARQIFIKNRCFCFLPGLYTFIFGKEENYFDELEQRPKPIPKNGFDRVRALFGYDKYGMESKEQTAIIQLTGFTLVFGTAIGIMRNMPMTYESFIATNLHEKFLSPYEAKRKMVDYVAVYSIKNGLKWGVKCAIFVLIYSSAVAIISAYRDKEGVLEHTVGGALAGAFTRMYLGYKATFAGAVLGSFLSSIVGILIVIANKGFNVSLDDVRQFQYEIKQNRKNALDDIKRSTDLFQNEYGPLLKKKMARLDSEDDYGYKTDDKDKVFVVVDPQANDNDNSKKET